MDENEFQRKYLKLHTPGEVSWAEMRAGYEAFCEEWGIKIDTRLLMFFRSLMKTALRSMGHKEKEITKLFPDQRMVN